MVQTFIKRPTSPLSFEPLVVPPEDVYWPGSDDEADEQEREKKKVRVEILGRQYLEGRPPFIQSASLRGPLDEDWVNPWAKRRKLYQTHGARHPGLMDLTTETKGQDEFGAGEPVIKRRSLNTLESKMTANATAANQDWEISTAKRRKRDQNTRLGGLGDINDQRKSTEIPRDIQQDSWLRKDSGMSYVNYNERGTSPTPAPAAKRSSKPLADPRVGSFHQTRKGLENNHHRISNSSPERRPSDLVASKESQDSYDRTPSHLSNTIGDGNVHIQTHQTSKEDVISNGLQKVKRSTGLNGEIAKAPEKAALQAIASKESMSKARKPPVDTQDQVFDDAKKPTLSRLTPYVSEIVQDDAATSAGFKAVKKSPKPSRHIAPPSTHLPEFRYRYTKKPPLSSISPGGKSKSANLGNSFPSRRRSLSTSSSGSSDFAEAFEAAQAKATSGSLASSSPVQKPETKSIRRNTQAMRRLTFDPSGEPKIAGVPEAARPNSSSSAIETPTVAEGRKATSVKTADRQAPIKKSSTNSSDLSLDKTSRNSVVLPEAQIVSDAPAHLGRVPSGPSTNLIETDKQSPKFVSLEEEDSYFDMSTQAAMTKAQTRFKEEIVSPAKISPEHGKRRATNSSNGNRQRRGETNVTPKTNGINERINKSVIKTEPREQEEPLSTQAIADAISPFAITTIKKKPLVLEKRTDFAPSTSRDVSPFMPSPDPTPTFQKPLSLATTPSNSQPKQSPPIPFSHPNTTSKPPSSLTSFSMLPNGTLTTETSVLQDGQQRKQDFDLSLPLDPFATPFATANGNGNGDGKQQSDSWDLDATIEEAGSFLGNWDVEAEARKEGSSARGRESAVKGILSVKKGSL